MDDRSLNKLLDELIPDVMERRGKSAAAAPMYNSDLSEGRRDKSEGRKQTSVDNLYRPPLLSTGGDERTPLESVLQSDGDSCFLRRRKIHVVVV